MKYGFSNAKCEEKRDLKLFITSLLTKHMLKEILNRPHDTKKMSGLPNWMKIKFINKVLLQEIRRQGERQRNKSNESA